eukprot:m.169402 g.169402  ORF g.169402 m.169402 type:complete len:62 (-) comp14495_c0_seq1:483-668(-)
MEALHHGYATATDDKHVRFDCDGVDVVAVVSESTLVLAHAEPWSQSLAQAQWWCPQPFAWH